MSTRPRAAVRLVTCLTTAAVVTLAAAGAAAAGSGTTGPAAVGKPRPAPAAEVSTSGAGQAVRGQYIVVFRPGTRGAADLARSLTREHGGALLHTYTSALQGFAARLPEGRAAALARNPNVVSVEQDRTVTVADTQTGATWGLDRSDQRSLPLDGAYTDGNEGAGVHLYVVDTGVRLDHTQFTGRLGAGYDAVTSGGSANDCNGHGTHVAGTAGGSTYGIADKVVLHPVRVLDCNGSGTNAGVIAGVDWVRARAVKPAVANMSLGGAASSALDTAVNNAINAGITFVVAAGNSNTNACTSSPARVAAALTVGATTSSDARSSFSNYGSCLDLFAPGTSITSAWSTGATAVKTISGTSMASPHVAGAAALHLSANPGASPAAVRNAVVAAGTTGKVTSPGTGSPNVLLHTPPLSGASTPPPTSSGLVNGGFESGATAWTQSPSGIITSTAVSGSRVRTGSWSAWLGGYNSADEALTQRVAVPAAGATLTYWWRLTSTESKTTAYDRMTVRVLDTNGAVLGTLRTRSNTAARDAWYSDSLSLAAYAGRTVVLRFGVTTDASVVSSFHVDDVSVR